MCTCAYVPIASLHSQAKCSTDGCHEQPIGAEVRCLLFMVSSWLDSRNFSSVPTKYSLRTVLNKGFSRI